MEGGVGETEAGDWGGGVASLLEDGEAGGAGEEEEGGGVSTGWVGYLVDDAHCESRSAFALFVVSFGVFGDNFDVTGNHLYSFMIG